MATKNVVQGSGNSTHTYTHEEKEAFVDYINGQLQGDGDLSGVVPLNIHDESIFEACKDGILLNKLINAAVPGTIDERVINKKRPLNAWQKNENHALMVNSAKAIGCNVVNIGAVDINEGRAHLIMGLLWQIIRIGLLSSITLNQHPELMRLLNEGESLEELFKLPPEQLLLRWFNYHLKEAGSQRRVNNWTSDLQDSESYTILLNRIAPNGECDKSAMGISDPKDRAERMLEQADKIGCRKFLTANDVVKGNPKLNLAFTANLFNQYPALAALEESDFAALMNFNSEGTREERAFGFWIQSLGIDISSNFYDDLVDGVVLLQVFDKVSPGIVDWKKVNRPAANRFKKVENCNYCVVLAKQLKFSTVNVGGTDIVDKNKKIILGMVWQLMRQNIINMLKSLSSEGKEIKDDDILRWANEKVQKAGRPTRMESFKDASLRTGVFLCDLCYAVAPKSVNMDLVTPGETPEDAEMNAKYAISVARKLGATLFLLWEDVVEVQPKMILTFVGGMMLASSQLPQQ